MSCHNWTNEGVIDVLRTTELWKCEPKHYDCLKKIVESYFAMHQYTSYQRGKGRVRSQYKIVLDQYSATLKKENTTQYVNHWVSSAVPALSMAFILSYANLLAKTDNLRSTGKDETNKVRKDLTTVVKENEEEVDESDTESKEHFRYFCLLFEFNHRRIFRQLIRFSQAPHARVKGGLYFSIEIRHILLHTFREGHDKEI